MAKEVMAEIRKATGSDLGAISSFDIFSGDREADIERGDCYVAIEGGHVAGYVVFNHSFFLRPFVQFLCVAPDFRRQGIANALLEYIEANCDGDRLFTSTESDNLQMLKLLSLRGYKVSGVIDNIQERAEVVYSKEINR